jgi:pilus assembly protein CpaF
MNYPLLILMVIILAVIMILLIKMAKNPGYRRRTSKKTYKLNTLTAAVNNIIEQKCNEDLTDSEFAFLSQSALDSKEEMREELRKNTLECAQGDPAQKNYMINKISNLLQKECGIKKSEDMKEIFPFDAPERLTAQDKFELMYACYQKMHDSYTFRYMDDDFGFYSEKTRPDGRKYYEVTAEDIEAAWEKFNLPVTFNEKLRMIAQRVYQTLYGHGVADIFTSDYSFDDVEGGVGGRLRDDFNYHEEIRDGKNDEDEEEDDRHGRIRKQDGNDKKKSGTMYYDVLSAKYMGKTARFSFLSFGTAESLSRVVDRIYLNNPKDVLCELTPKVQSKLKDPGESRVMVFCPPEANKSFYVRHPASNKRLTLDELIRWRGAEIVKRILITLVKGEFNIFITGNPGGGKTTLVKTLVEYLDPSYEIRTVESEAELNLNNIYPDKNVHALIESASRDIYECIEDTKKMNTDVLIIGEVNSERLAGAAVQVSQSGSTMCMTTMHPNKTEQCFDYMRNGLVKYEGITDVHVAAKQVLDVFNFDVHQVRDTEGHRYIEYINEVVPVEYDDYSDDPEENAKQYHERVTDRKLYDVNRIIEFDKQHMEYHVVGNLSAKTLERLVEKIGLDATKELKKKLNDLKVAKIDYAKMLEDSLEEDELTYSRHQTMGEVG